MFRVCLGFKVKRRVLEIGSWMFLHGVCPVFAAAVTVHGNQTDFCGSISFHAVGINHGDPNAKNVDDNLSSGTSSSRRTTTTGRGARVSKACP